MINKRTLVNLLKGTFLSMLVFFTLTFFSVIYSIKHPEFHGEMHFGFPFKFYHQFWLSGNDYPNFGGNFLNLLFDCLICWVVVTGIFLLVQKKIK